LMSYRFFFGAGPGNIIAAHQPDFDGVMSVTFSSEFEAFCKATHATALMVSSWSPAETLRDGEFTLENRPKRPASGWRYHIEELRYGLYLAWSALRFGATHAFLQSGSTHYFMMAIFRTFGIKTIPIMHNALWPAGYSKTSALKRAIRWLDGLFFRYGASAVLAVSPECARQVSVLTKGRHAPIEIFTIQFNEELFKPIPPVPLANKVIICFAGRVTENKGALDLIEIARQVSSRMPAEFHLCGDGPDLQRISDLVRDQNLQNVVRIHGWTQPVQLRNILASSHLSIVPTRSDFNEGMAMTAIEAVLLGRPIVTSPVVPAAEVLRNACVLAKTDDPSSYAMTIVDLAADHERYADLCSACLSLREQFFDRSRSCQAAMQTVLSRLG
jgi:glycosyltransferase involved in cell wall biosynthesis